MSPTPMVENQVALQDWIKVEFVEDRQSKEQAGKGSKVRTAQTTLPVRDLEDLRRVKYDWAFTMVKN